MADLRCCLRPPVGLLVVPHSGADDAAHREEDAPGGDPEGQPDQVDVGEETSANNVLEGHEVLTEDFAVQARKHSVCGICEGTDAGHAGADCVEHPAELVDAGEDRACSRGVDLEHSTRKRI